MRNKENINPNLGVQYPVEMVIDERTNSYVNPEGHYVIKKDNDYLAIVSSGLEYTHTGVSHKMPCRDLPNIFVHWTADEKCAAEWHAGAPDRIIIKDHHGKVASGWMGDVVSLFLIMREHGGHLVWVSRKTEHERTPENYVKQLNIKLTEKDLHDMEHVNKDFFDNEITNSTLGRILLRKGILVFLSVEQIKVEDQIRETKRQLREDR